MHLNLQRVLFVDTVTADLVSDLYKLASATSLVVMCACTNDELVCRGNRRIIFFNSDHNLYFLDRFTRIYFQSCHKLRVKKPLYVLEYKLVHYL